jgi:hypothetical protein
MNTENITNQVVAEYDQHEKAEKQSNSSVMRTLRCQISQCLDETIKQKNSH